MQLKVLEYTASRGKEFFISVEDVSQDILVGFLRLRFPSQYLLPGITSESALVRELHVYGTSTGLGEKGEVQHRGWGKKLIKKAEELAAAHGKNKLVVISGVGVREYYKKLGYRLESFYMVKYLKRTVK